MKKIILAIAVTVIFAGCGGYDNDGCRFNARKFSKNSEFYEIKEYRYLVKDTLGNVIYLETMNQTNTDITKIDTVFYAKH